MIWILNYGAVFEISHGMSDASSLNDCLLKSLRQLLSQNLYIRAFEHVECISFTTM